MLGLANTFNCRPSAFFGDIDDYTAYCIDEAACLIIRNIEEGLEPNYEKKKEEFKSFSDFYKQFE